MLVAGAFSDIYRKEAFHGNGETLSIDLSPGSEDNFWRILYRYPNLFAESPSTR